MATIEAKGVIKSFGPNTVLNGIDLLVAPGQMVSLIGASGSGKSTLLRCLNLLEPIDDGAILLDGMDISEPGLDPLPVRRRIGIVFQSFNLFPHMTAAENVLLAPRRVTGRSRAALLPEVTALFDRFGLADRMGHYPDQLSGGPWRCAPRSCSLTRSPRPSIPNSWARCWRFCAVCGPRG
jgi:polar amino acid transport system ATP-binding protein